MLFERESDSIKGNPKRFPFLNKEQKGQERMDKKKMRKVLQKLALLGIIASLSAFTLGGCQKTTESKETQTEAKSEAKAYETKQEEETESTDKAENTEEAKDTDKAEEKTDETEEKTEEKAEEKANIKAVKNMIKVFQATKQQILQIYSETEYEQAVKELEEEETK